MGSYFVYQLKEEELLRKILHLQWDLALEAGRMICSQLTDSIFSIGIAFQIKARTKTVEGNNCIRTVQHIHSIVVAVKMNVHTSAKVIAHTADVIEHM